MSNVDVDFNGQQGENIQVDSCNFSSINNNSLDLKHLQNLLLVLMVKKI